MPLRKLQATYYIVCGNTLFLCGVFVGARVIYYTLYVIEARDGKPAGRLGKTGVNQIGRQALCIAYN